MLLTIAFLERADFHSGAVGPLHALRNRVFDDARFATLPMEAMVLRPTERLGALLRAGHPGHLLPPAAQRSFEAIAGRRPGEVDDASHYRSGQPGQWRQALPDAAIAYLRAHSEPVLRRFYPGKLAPEDPWPNRKRCGIGWRVKLSTAKIGGNLQLLRASGVSFSRSAIAETVKATHEPCRPPPAPPAAKPSRFSPSPWRSSPSSTSRRIASMPMRRWCVARPGRVRRRCWRSWTRRTCMPSTRPAG
jgi:hypothetical protein